MNKKAAHITEFQYIEAISKLSNMHNLKTNFDKFLELTNRYLANSLNTSGNVKLYKHKPKMPDNHIIALSICQEALGIDSENYFWSKLKTDYRREFPELIHLTRYNLRKKSLAPFILKLNQAMAEPLNEGENVYIVDSMPIPVCKNAREKRLKACCHDFETKPDKGYSAINQQYFIGYKLHLVTSLRGVFFSMDLSKASVHDLHYLNDLKYSGMNNCTLLADAGYISSEYQTDLFHTARVEVKTPMRNNQNDFKPYPFVFKKSRKRIETMFSQLCDQMLIKRNYAKSFAGLAVRVLAKVTATTALQTLNTQNGKPLNHIKHALAA
jgi:hypothetical protein